MKRRMRLFWTAVHSIRFKLLTSLFVLLGLSIAVSMAGIWTFERDRYVETARAEAMRVGRTIEKTLRSAMLENDRDKIKQSVAALQKIIEPSVISILTHDGTVAISSDPSLEGRRIDRVKEKGCAVCHAPGAVPSRNAVILETAAGPLLRNIIKVPNGPECYRCHPPAQKDCGILVYDVPFSGTFAMLRTVLFRSVLTGLLTFLFVSIVLSLIIQRFVHRPLHQLREGFLHVGRGDFNHWVSVDAKGEFQEMADQFNVMNQAIGRSFTEIKQKNWVTASLYTFVQQLSQAVEWEKLRRLVTNLLFETFAVHQVVVMLRQEKKDGDLFELSWRVADDRRFHHRQFDARAQPRDLPGCIMERWEDWQRGGLTVPAFTDQDSRVLLPLASKQAIIGLICIKKEDGEVFGKEEKKLILAVGEQIGISLANARLYRMAITDSLTGLYARRYCEAVIRKFLDVGESGQNSPFCALMLDLDHFKKVNDTHGHQVGDEVLAQVAHLIRANIRYDDIACRYGGEEFIVLVTGDLEVGREAAHRLRQVVAAHVFKTKAVAPLRITISLGVASFPQHGKTEAVVIGAADQALYEAKKQGRDRVICFGDR